MPSGTESSYPDPDSWILAAQKEKKENFSQALSILYKHEFNPCPSFPSVTTDNRKQVRWLINESLKGGGVGGGLGNRNYLYNKDRGVAQVRVTMITPPATPEMIVKLKKQLEFHRPIRYSSVDFEFVLKHLFLLVAEKGLVVNTLLAS